MGLVAAGNRAIAHELTDILPQPGNPFQRLRDHVYAAGGARDPSEAYVAFRGRMPTVDALLEKRGLSA